MGTVQSLGIGSGLNINEIVTALVDAERQPRELALENKKEEAEAKISAYGEFKSYLSTLQSSISDLRQATNFNKVSATSSDTATFTASASSIADLGTYSVVVDQVAQAQSLSTAAYASVDDTIGTGTITIKFGTTNDPDPPPAYDFTQDTSVNEQTITVDGENNTVSTLRDYINSGDYGVNASIVNDGTGYRLVLTAAESGADNSMQITVSGDSDGDDEDAGGLSALRFDGTQTSMTQNVAGQNASFSVNGISITSETNTISNAINGVTFNLLAADTGVTKTLTVAADTSEFEDQINEFIDAYNAAATFVDEVTDYNVNTQEAGLLLGDSTLRNAFSQIRSTMFDSVDGVSTSLKSLIDIGILSSQSDGTIELDSTELSSVLNDPEQLGNLFSLSGQTTDSLISYVSAASTATAGTYYVNITQVATRGVLVGSAGHDFGGGSLDIDGDNDEFTIRVDGISSGTITLDSGNYTSGDTLASDIQTKINADTSLSDAGLSVSVTYDSANDRFEIESSTYGSDSMVAITAIDTNSESELGFAVATGTNGKDVAGTISTTQATQAVYNATGVISAGSVTIDSDNDEFIIKVDGTTSGTITLTSNTYADGDALATEIETQINADATLAAANKEVTVTYDSTNERLEINSKTYGSTSSVELTSIDTDSASELGFYVGVGNPGSGSIDSSESTGEGRFLLATSGDASGLKINVNGGSYENNFGVNRGSVTFSRGIADQLDTLLESILEEDGILDSRTDGLQSTIDDADEDLRDLDRNIARLEARLFAQFSAMDALVGQLNNISNFLSSSLSALPGAGSQNQAQTN